MFTRFDAAYALATPALLPYLAWRRWRRGKYTESARGMRGALLPQGSAAQVFNEGSLWVHAVSVGETVAATTVVPGLRALLPALPLVVSTITETGQAHARRLFPEDHTTYFPADLSWNVRRFQATFNPRAFVLMETELWPNFLMQARMRGTACFMLNAKLSDRSFPRYRRFRPVLAPAFAALRGVCTQTAQDAERFAALGIAPERIVVTGNCKFDMPDLALDDAARSALLAQLGMSPARRWLVAGSTHPGEEAMLLQTFRALHATMPDLGLLLCPRHPERFNEVYALASQAGLPVARASASQPGGDPAIVVLDQMGVLARAYGLGTLAIVAGSFCPVGGHNLMEAAVHGIPVVFGPQMHSQREILRIFQQAGVGVQVPAEQLAERLQFYLTNDVARAEEGQASLRVLDANRGSAARAVVAVGQWLKADQAP